MKQAILQNGFSSQPLQITYNPLAVAKQFKNANHAKACNYRTENGFCTRSNRQCPVTLFTLTLNN
jgi:hypothetical protein